jgi:hypothetical protein
MTLLGIAIVGLSAILDEASSDIYSSVRRAFVKMQIIAMDFLIIVHAFQAFKTIVKEVADTGGWKWLRHASERLEVVFEWT